MLKNFSRRDLLRGCGIGLGSVYALSKLPFGLAQKGRDPHFFLQIYIPGGVDVSYTFDARPVEMNQQNMQHNILEEEPFPHLGINGGRCMRTQVTKLLDSHLDDFSIINGIHMSAFDGHEQNISYLMTGNPFGGDAFIPSINTKQRAALDFVRLGDGNFLVQLSNDSNAVHLSVDASRLLSERVIKQGRLGLADSPLDYIIDRATVAAGDMANGFNQAAMQMQNGLRQIPHAASALRDFYTKIHGINTQDDDADIITAGQLVTALFRESLTPACVFVFNSDLNPNLDLDAHADTAKILPQNLATVFRKTSALLQTLKDTPYNDQLSMFDCTTVLICSEFGRTMRSMGLDDRKVNEAGTDHNQFVNTALLGGKGIRGGLVLGASDLASAAEFHAKAVSAAHLQMDSKLEKVMGKPFNYQTFSPSATLPQIYAASDYLAFPSVANTILKCFDVNASQHLSLSRNAPAAPVLTPLLKT